MKELRRRGFTLIELLAVIAIVGVLSGVAVTNLHDDGSEELITATGGRIRYLPGEDGSFGQPVDFRNHNQSAGARWEQYHNMDYDAANTKELVELDITSIDLMVKVDTPANTAVVVMDGRVDSSMHVRMSVADISGDGYRDVIIHSVRSEPVESVSTPTGWWLDVLLGDKDGRLQEPILLVTDHDVALQLADRGSLPDLADIDGDGDNDIILLDPESNEVVLFLNESRPDAVIFDGFELVGSPQPPAAPLPAGPPPVALPSDTNFGSVLGATLAAIAHGDLNGDGYLDFVLANLENDEVKVRFGDGSGFLADAKSFPAGDGALVTGLADVNGDGFIDILTGNSLGDDISALLGDGVGGFAAPIKSLTGSVGLMGMSLADLNRDGCIDAIVGSTNGVDSSDVSVMPGNCTGEFGEQAVGIGGIGFDTGDGPVAVSLGDIDGDGDLDAVTANELSLDVTELLGNGRGAFGPPRHVGYTGNSNNPPRAATLADMDGDGTIDSYVVIAADASFHWLANEALFPERDPTSAVFASFNYKYLSYLPHHRAPVAVADLDGDGRPDVLTTNIEHDKVVVVFGPEVLALGASLHQVNYDMGSLTPRFAAVGDFDGNGRPDVVTVNDGSSNNVSVLINLGGAVRSALFDAPVHYTANPTPVHVALDDIDGDGDLDIVTANNNDFAEGNYAATVLLGDGDGTFTLDRHYDAGGFARRVLLGDADNDGAIDMILQSRTTPLTGSAWVLNGDGSGTFWVPTPILPTFVADLALGDMNGNVGLDLVTADYDNDRINVWLSSVNLCPDDPNNDVDDDQVCGNVDNCPNRANADQANADGDAAGDLCDLCPGDADDDLDGDEVCGDLDNCPGIANVGQADVDNDGLGDDCDECADDADNDRDDDGICGDLDNCPGVANVGQADADGDGVGDSCDDCDNDSDNDPDGDGVCGDLDNCPAAANPRQLDADGDGVGSACDVCPADALDDVDGDELCSDVDNCPSVANAGQSDADGDGLGDACDSNDSDGSGTPEGGGCSCLSSAAPSWWLLGLLLVWPRRRRR